MKMEIHTRFANLPYPKLLPLGQGRILVRFLNQGDRELVFDLFRDASDEELQALKEDFKNPRAVEQWFDRLDYRQVLPLSALDLNSRRLIAVSLLIRGALAARHNGEIRLFVSQPYREPGLTALLLDEVLELAVKHDLLWLSAEVMGDDHRAVEAFRAKGFALKTTFEQYLRRPDGTARDVVLLRRLL